MALSSSERKSRDFHHPYTPYEIQDQFMNALYDCIEEGKGKSLSLICGSLTWLRDHKQRDFGRQLEVTGEDDDEPAWMVEHARGRTRQRLLRQQAETEARLKKIRDREKRQRDRYVHGEPRAKKNKVDEDASGAGMEDDDDAAFLLDDYESGDEASSEHRSSATQGLSAETRQLMEKLGAGVPKPAEEEVGGEDELKIFYCSRTHSQLTQFINELRRVKLPPALPEEPVEAPNAIPDTVEELKHLTLGSRKNLCIYERVSKLGSATAINERCLELQKSGTAKDCKCPHLPTRENEALVNDFRDHSLAVIRDIEELAVLGKRLGICPYYASRPTIKPSEIVTLPYPLLLQKSARQALNLSLKGHIVIIDEAHNLMDAIANIHSARLSMTHLTRSRAQLGIYLQKFRNRLKGSNRIYLTQLVRLLDSLMGGLKAVEGQREGIVKVGDLMSGKGVDQINLNRLLLYLQESKLARKVARYVQHTMEGAPALTRKTVPRPTKPGADISTPALTHVQDFLAALTNPSAEGRIFHARTDDNHQCLKYMLLDPTHHFREILQEARAVILAGGTMSPMSDYTDHLFAYLPRAQIRTLSCGHVIPPDNLLAWPVCRGPSNIEFDFTFSTRGQNSMVDELGRAIAGFSQVIPGGVVVFFPSYAYLDQVVQRWQVRSTTGPSSIWDRLARHKQVFRESKDSPGVEDVLHDYAQAIDAGHGGLLLSVVGGKLSEGINFSDKLGRGVVIVGLPFPNIHSAEWKAKLEHVENSAFDRSAAVGTPLQSIATRRAEAKSLSREYYENACMRAVNQCIGRAIRHQNDYASILLLDRRYDSERIRSKLPAWIQRSLVKDAAPRSFGDVSASLEAFFRSKGELVK